MIEFLLVCTVVNYYFMIGNVIKEFNDSWEMETYKKNNKKKQQKKIGDQIGQSWMYWKLASFF